MKRYCMAILWILILTGVWSCAPAYAQTGTSVQATPLVSTSVGYPGPILQPTGYPSPIGQPTAAPGGSPTGYPAPVGTPGITKEITLDQNGKKVSLRRGETFQLKLGGQYLWTIEIDRTEVVNRVPHTGEVPGAQGIYQANQPGTATLTADGDPLCRQAKPACAMPSLRFIVQIEVLP